MNSAAVPVHIDNLVILSPFNESTKVGDTNARTDIGLVEPSLPTQEVLLWREESSLNYETNQVRVNLEFESSTLPDVISITLYQEAEYLFASAKDEVFEDGLDSFFSKALVSRVQEYGDAFVDVLAHFILARDANEEVAWEALRWLGKLSDAKTYVKRLWLLERSLASSSPVIRDGAGLGLAALDDRHAIPYLKLAIQREEISILRSNLEQVLTQLIAAK
jgi:hypothetical protein